MRRWPPVLWLLVYVGSVFILLGSRGRTGFLVAGAAMVLIACASAVYLALRDEQREPRPPGSAWAIGGVAAFYLVAAVTAGVILGAIYGVATLLAGLIPATAVAIVLATTRQKPAAAGHDDDPLPGMSFDTSTPLGDTSEHSDVLDDPATTPDGGIRR
jgi:hypothetical protein